MPTRAWFPTYIYCEPLQKSGLARLNSDLADECRRLREFDEAGRKWSEKNYPGGYTSYASMNELPILCSFGERYGHRHHDREEDARDALGKRVPHQPLLLQ